MTETDFEETPEVTETPRPKAPGRYKVRLSHPNEHKKVVFSTVDENRARKFVERRYPRGSEAYLEKPDGTFESHEKERQNQYGQDVASWDTFDPESYKPPEEQEPPGESAWADRES